MLRTAFPPARMPSWRSCRPEYLFGPNPRCHANCTTYRTLNAERFDHHVAFGGNRLREVRSALSMFVGFAYCLTVNPLSPSNLAISSQKTSPRTLPMSSTPMVVLERSGGARRSAWRATFSRRIEKGCIFARPISLVTKSLPLSPLAAQPPIKADMSPASPPARTMLRPPGLTRPFFPPCARAGLLRRRRRRARSSACTSTLRRMPASSAHASNRRGHNVEMLSTITTITSCPARVSGARWP